MVRPGREWRSGRVEVDDTYLGGLEEGVRGRETFKKALVVVAAQEDGNGIGRIRISNKCDKGGKDEETSVYFSSMFFRMLWPVLDRAGKRAADKSPVQIKL